MDIDIKPQINHNKAVGDCNTPLSAIDTSLGQNLNRKSLELIKRLRKSNGSMKNLETIPLKH